jgi:hypothetical protein
MARFMTKKNLLKIASASVLLVLAPRARADTFTTRLGLVKPTIGSLGWGTKWNNNADLVDSGMGILAVPNAWTSTNTFSMPVGFGVASPTPNFSLTTGGGLSIGQNSFSSTWNFDQGGLHIEMPQAKDVDASGGFGAVKIFANNPHDSTLQGTFALVTASTPSWRHGLIECIEQGSAFRDFRINQSGGDVVFGSTNPGLGLFDARQGTNQHIIFDQAGISLSGAAGISVVNDAGNTNEPLEIRASTTAFTAGDVVIGTTQPAVGLFQVHQGTNKNIILDKAGVTLANAVGISAVNDAGNANIPLEIRATQSAFTAGGVAFGNLAPYANVTVGAGGASAGTAAVALTSGTVLATPVGGVVEWNGTNLFITQNVGPTRKTFAYIDSPLSGFSGTLSGSSVSGGTFGAVNGSALTSLTAANITGSNTLPDGVLSTNVPLLNTANTWTKPQTISTSVAGAFVVNSTNLVVNGATNRVGVGIAPVAGVMQIKGGTDEDIQIGSGVAISTAVVINAVNDAAGLNVPLEIRANWTAITMGNFAIGLGGGVPTAQLHTGGTVRFANFGAGTATFDANGNISSVSDIRMKDVDGPFTRGLHDILGIQPILYHWKAESGLDTENQYAGFSAQDVLPHIPEATLQNKDGFYSFQDRPVIAALVNAVKELSAKVDALQTQVNDLTEAKGYK